MNSDALVRPLSGAGLVARAGDLLLVCVENDEAGQLLDVFHQVVGAGGDGGVLVRRVAALIAADFDGRFPDCAVSGPAADGRLAVLVHGEATADVVGGDGAVRLSGADSITSVNRMVPGPITTVRLQLPGAGTAHPRARLDAGVIVAAGLVVGAGVVADAAGSVPASRQEGSLPNAVPAAPTPAPAHGAVIDAAAPVADQRMGEAPAPAEQVGAAPPFTPELPSRPFTMEPPRPPSPSPPSPSPPSPPPPSPPQSSPQPPVPQRPVPQSPAPLPPPAEEPAGVPVPAALAQGALDAPEVDGAAEVRPLVLGVVCQNEHLNDPNALVCDVCGVNLAGQPLLSREAPRPSLGVLLLDDGTVFQLDTDYVIGREPENDPDVLAGLARPLRVLDTEGVVSRRHVRVRLTDWDVHVCDLGSANGTFVDASSAGEADRQQLSPNEPVRILPGAQVTIGRRWLRYERDGTSH